MWTSTRMCRNGSDTRTRRMSTQSLSVGLHNQALIGRHGITTILWCTSNGHVRCTHVIVLYQQTTHIQSYSVDQSQGPVAELEHLYQHTTHIQSYSVDQTESRLRHPICRISPGRRRSVSVHAGRERRADALLLSKAPQLTTDWSTLYD